MLEEEKKLAPNSIQIAPHKFIYDPVNGKMNEKQLRALSRLGHSSNRMMLMTITPSSDKKGRRLKRCVTSSPEFSRTATLSKGESKISKDKTSKKLVNSSRRRRRSSDTSSVLDSDMDERVESDPGRAHFHTEMNTQFDYSDERQKFARQINFENCNTKRGRVSQLGSEKEQSWGV